MAEIPALEDIRQRVLQAFADEPAEVAVDTDGYYVTVQVVSARFEGVRAVARQQMVYAALADLITSGALHAVIIKAMSPQEYSSWTN